VRRLTRETQLSVDDLIWAMVVHEGSDDEIPVAAMPGTVRLFHPRRGRRSQARPRRSASPPSLCFRSLTQRKKEPSGKEALNANGLVCNAVRAMKDAAPDVGIMVDVALDPFTDHGHDGLLKDGRIANDDTVKVLVEQAIVQTRAGADIVAPSDMMDGRVGAIRAGLDGAGFQDTLIMSYAAKYASAFYGPYREAIGSGKLGSGAERQSWRQAHLSNGFRKHR
jgi:porphobilinogen synthase